MTKISWSLLALTAAPFILSAQATHQSSQIPHSETTAGMVEQSQRDLKEANRQLTSVYARLLSRLDGPGKANLRRAQRAWIQYRDAQVAFEGSMYEGGSIRPVIEGNWLVTMTNDRAKELQLTLDSDFEQP